MTAREKAEDLYNKYLWQQRKLNILASSIYAKECALIAVDEMLYLLKNQYERNNICTKFDVAFLRQVKKEIENYEK